MPAPTQKASSRAPICCSGFGSGWAWMAASSAAQASTRIRYSPRLRVSPGPTGASSPAGARWPSRARNTPLALESLTVTRPSRAARMQCSRDRALDGSAMVQSASSPRPTAISPSPSSRRSISRVGSLRWKSLRVTMTPH